MNKQTCNIEILYWNFLQQIRLLQTLLKDLVKYCFLYRYLFLWAQRLLNHVEAHIWYSLSFPWFVAFHNLENIAQHLPIIFRHILVKTGFAYDIRQIKIKFIVSLLTRQVGIWNFIWFSIVISRMIFLIFDISWVYNKNSLQNILIHFYFLSRTLRK